MDFITEKIEKRIQFSAPGTIDRRSLLQARVEYLYYWMLGYLWNKHRENLSIDQLSKFMNQLEGKLTIGSIVMTLKEFDKNHELVNNTIISDILNKYTKYRNANIGHGYMFSDKIEEDEEILTRFYEDILRAIPLLAQKMDIVVINPEDGTQSNGTVSGMVFKYEDRGEPSPWCCRAELLDLPTEPPHIYYRTQDGRYFRVSPFVLVEGLDAKIYVFNAIKQKFTGKTAYTQLFASEKKDFIIQEFVDTSVTNEYSRKSANGTVMNYFTENHRKYIEVGLTKKITNFTENNVSVSAVLWGNGGVGKTACAQKICLDLFNGSKQKFEYIVFVTAKDRRFNEVTGQIESLENNQSFYGVIDAIYSTVHGRRLECAEGSEEFETVIKEIQQMQGDEARALLLVVDDFETFADIEKEKISKFINSDDMASGLDVRNHKVVITTRNSHLAQGTQISASELSQQSTIDFLRAKIKENYPQNSSAFERLITDANVAKKIYNATGGVPIFILQWLHLYVQNPSDEELYQQLETREAAREFLSGRVYQSLRENARKVYAVLSVVAIADQTFQLERLRYVLENSMTADALDDALRELEKLCIIEPYQIDNQIRLNSLYRVYSKSFLDDMQAKYKELDRSTRDQMAGRLKRAGGNTTHSLFDALLIEARKTRGTGEETKVVSSYRHIIKMDDCPYAVRRQALIELMGYYFSYQNNLDKIIETHRTYLPVFPKDPVVLYKYIYFLWGGSEPEYRSIAFQELDNYYDESLQVHAENVQFFALGAAYYTIYLVANDVQASRMQLERAFEISNALYNYVSKANDATDLRAIQNYRHEIKVALVQLVRLTANMAILDSQYANTCNVVADYFLNHYEDSKMECASVRKQKDSVQELLCIANSVPIQQEEVQTDLDSNTVIFVPQYIKRNLDGLPQYLNGEVNGVKAGIAWYDFEKFGWELTNLGGIDIVMEKLIQCEKGVPAVITGVSERGMYSLSLYDTGMALCDIVKWEQKPQPIAQKMAVGKSSAASNGTNDTENISEGDLVEFTYNGKLVQQQRLRGIFGYVNTPDNKALLHISQLDSTSFITENDMLDFVEVCERKKVITVKVVQHTENGLRVGLDGVTPGFWDLLNE